MYPGPVGAHTVQAMSFSPRSGLVYIPTNDIATVYSDPPGELAAWRPNPGMVINNGIGKPPADIKMPPSRSWLQGWDPVQQRKAWEVPLTGPFNGGTAATAGNLVFQGQGTGEFNAYAADTGAKLWSFDAQAGVIAQPITYSVDGKQYVTVLAGWRGPGGTRPVEWDYYTQPRRVLTFTLDGAAKLPAEKRPVQPFADDPAFVVDTAKAALGKEVFSTRCFLCHGSNAVSGGTAPDLRRAAIPLSLDALKAVLHDGLLMPRGMPQYQELPIVGNRRLAALHSPARARVDRRAAALSQGTSREQPGNQSMNRSQGQSQMPNKATSVIIALVLTVAVGTASIAQATTVNNRVLADEKDGRNWASFGRTFSENHYSPLTQINDKNVAGLGLAWSYDLPRVSSVFAAPLAVDGVLYFAIGYSVVHAIDARTGKLLWKYDPRGPQGRGPQVAHGLGHPWHRVLGRQGLHGHPGRTPDRARCEDGQGNLEHADHPAG